ncbi:fungal-specific transcription factor domain-containing protein [Exophiala viscosa]|uniref:fungal-specific transcription factor domain-containing protein n=1 Tax=Exophiala viscosa TaxID=2486360 RepID=UPI0021922733|nr:fungal-specific transcription factor domain-containing protein [Exophiala viscosa]
MDFINTTISEADLTRLLPTCQRCRRLRRKCDTNLPACRLCQKGKVECTFFDHALQQTLPRSYVHSLLNRLSRLRSVQATVNGTSEPPTTFHIAQHECNTSAASTHLEPPLHEWGTYTSDLSFDKHFIVENANPTCWQFLGSSSPYALIVEVLVHAQAKLGSMVHNPEYVGPEFWLNAQSTEVQEPLQPRSAPARSEVEMLVNLYMSTTNILVAFFDPEEIALEIDTYLRHHGPQIKYLTGKDAYQFFHIAMICAIASANKGRHHSAYDTECMAYYTEALQCVEEVTSDVSVEALQALLLLTVFGLFHPRKGDIWKLLDFACRLSVELSYHTETNDDYEDQKSKKKRRSIFWGLYCIERTMGQHLGRPSDLTEEIITAEYPASIADSSLADPSSLQVILTSHYYRLTYLRSEIFRELYLPAVAPNLSRMWYERSLEQILSWRRELQFLDTALGMGSMTCEIGFDTSILFLFQPLLLRALVATKEPMLSQTTTESIPRESYHSAVKIIEYYNKILRGAEGTPWGMYPISIISAHYIHQATITILAHCLLAIDGRLPVVSFSSELSGDAEGPVDFNGIHEISGTCLILLNTLSKRWAGMVGILDIYKNLQAKVLPIMMRSGLG